MSSKRLINLMPFIFRVQVVAVRPDEEAAEIFFVDSGRQRKTPTYRLYLLPEKFASLPYQVHVVQFTCKDIGNEEGKRA